MTEYEIVRGVKWSDYPIEVDLDEGQTLEMVSFPNNSDEEMSISIILSNEGLKCLLD